MTKKTSVCLISKETGERRGFWVNTELMNEAKETARLIEKSWNDVSVSNDIFAKLVDNVEDVRVIAGNRVNAREKAYAVLGSIFEKMENASSGILNEVYENLTFIA